MVDAPHRSPVLVALLAAGCTEPAAETCHEYAYTAWGRGHGAWDGADGQTAPGVPVSSSKGAWLGSTAHVTSVVWRVDGGDVNDALPTKWADGDLVTPEYLQLSFRAKDGVVEGVASGFLSVDRDREAAVDLVEGFLNLLHRGDNHGPADLVVGIAYNESGLYAKDSPGAQAAGFHAEVVLQGTFFVADHLDEYSTRWHLTDRILAPTITAGPWRWELGIPHDTQRTADAGQSWSLVVDARDWILVTWFVDEPQTRDGVIEAVEQFLYAQSVQTDVGAWDLKVQDEPSRTCPPDEGGPLRGDAGDSPIWKLLAKTGSILVIEINRAVRPNHCEYGTRRQFYFYDVPDIWVHEWPHDESLTIMEEDTELVSPHDATFDLVGVRCELIQGMV